MQLQQGNYRGIMKKLSIIFLITVILTSCLSTDPYENGVCVAQFVPERADDFAFENDLTAWRAYGPALLNSPEDSGLDIWFKAVDYPVMEKLYFQALKRGKSYHEFRGEAYDPYHVGKSFGVGASALTDGKNVYRSNVYRSYKILSESGDVVSFVLTYLYEAIPGVIIEELKTFTLAKGSYFVDVDVELKVLEGSVDRLNLMPAVGITLHDGKIEAVKIGGAGLSAAVYEKIDGHGLFTAVVVKKSDLIWTQKVAMPENPMEQKDESDVLLIASRVLTDEGLNYRYSAGYGWSGHKTGAIKTVEEWQKIIDLKTSN